ncbi:MAG TPA: hypothetical protein VFE47_12390 [Tepidisphaeraceae bacterium]|jgi:hypothetical protein|nr:hypothetical protein [Tepidisphaeraceae bacterium]
MTDFSPEPAALKAPIATPSGPPAQWLALAVAVIAILAFCPIIANSFIMVDDPATVQNNPDFNPPADNTAGNSTADTATAWPSLAHYWTAPVGERYTPITYTLWGALSFIARTNDAQGLDTGLSPAVYHAFSLLLHALNSVLVFLILRKLVAGEWAAFFGALLFAVHPLQTETVAWVSQASILLSCVFSLGAMLAFLAFTDRRFGWAGKLASQTSEIQPAAAPRGGGMGFYCLATLLLALGLLSNPLAAVTPVLVLIIEWLRRRKLRAVAGPLGFWIVLCVPIVAMTHHWQTATLPTPIQRRPVVAIDALAFYLYKLLLPIGLLPSYGRTPAWLFSQHSIVAWSWAGPAVLLLLSVLLWRKARWVAGAALLFAVAVLPGMGLDFLGFQSFSTVSDRFVYVAMLGAALVLAGIIAREPRPTTYAAVALLLAFMAGLSIRQAIYWNSTGRLYTRVIQLEPDNRDAQELVARAYDDQGKTFLKAGNRHAFTLDMEEAKKHFLIAASLSGDDGVSYFNAAQCDVALRQLEVAIQDVDRALRDPKFPLRSPAYLFRGQVQEKLGNLDAAGQDYKKSLAFADQPQEQKIARLSLRGLEMHRSVGPQNTTQPAK